MARKTIADLEKQLEQYREWLNQATARNAELVKQANEGFEASALYKSMKAELDLMRKYEDLNISDNARHKGSLQNAQETLKLVSEDNKALLANMGIEYWAGISKPEEYADCLKWQSKYNRAAAEVEVLKEILQFLREYIRAELYKEDDTEVVDIVQPQKTGRKSKMDPVLIKRVKKYRRENYAVRKIAQIEGISVGLVHKIFHLCG